jgi:peptidoglycan hydrolase-like protein with peptidoglycan-binding domain
VDDHFSAATAEAVEDWQDALGLDDTGAIDVGDVVVEPGEVRIGSHLLTIGQQAGAALEVSGTGRVVTVDLPADRQGLITAGDDVQVELSDGSTVAGRVFAVGRVVTPADETDPSSSATVEVAVGIVDPTEVPDIDQAPVRVSIATTTATDVLTVPVEALIALAEGGYAVERAPGEDPPAAGATPDLLAVEVGVFAGGRVEVTGDLEAGDHVVVPAS